MALLEGNGDLCLSLWFCYEEGDDNNVITFLYGGGFLFLFCSCLWFSSLELTFSNNWWSFV
jgi:hypothetical protein